MVRRRVWLIDGTRGLVSLISLRTRPTRQDKRLFDALSWEITVEIPFWNPTEPVRERKLSSNDRFRDSNLDRCYKTQGDKSNPTSEPI